MGPLLGSSLVWIKVLTIIVVFEIAVLIFYRAWKNRCRENNNVAHPDLELHGVNIGVNLF